MKNGLVSIQKTLYRCQIKNKIDSQITTVCVIASNILNAEQQALLVDDGYVQSIECLASTNSNISDINLIL